VKRLIPLDSQIASAQAETTGSQPGSTGVGFAIASSTVTAVVKAIESGATGTTSAATPSGLERGASSPSREREASGSPGEVGAGEGQVAIVP
jgi:hypothetical protein